VRPSSKLAKDLSLKHAQQHDTVAAASVFECASIPRAMSWLERHAATCSMHRAVAIEPMHGHGRDPSSAERHRALQGPRRHGTKYPCIKGEEKSLQTHHMYYVLNGFPEFYRVHSGFIPLRYQGNTSPIRIRFNEKRTSSHSCRGHEL
jgi:hypothetical protein